MYGRLVKAIPDAYRAEVAYTAKVFPRGVSYATGWVMLLVYFVVCPYEAVAIGRIAGYLVPALNTHEGSHRVGDSIVYLPHLVLGLLLTAVFVAVNCRGVAVSARFLRWTTFAELALVAALAASGVSARLTRQLPAAVQPLAGAAVRASGVADRALLPDRLRLWVGKCAEEANPDLQR